MAIGRKASKKTTGEKTTGVNVDALIEKGGSHAGERGKAVDDEVQKITVRLPKNLVDQIDEAINERPISISRNQWLAEAAYAALRSREGA